MCYGNWLTQFWRLRNPTICRLQTGEPGKPGRDSVWVGSPKNQRTLRCSFQSEAEGLRTRRAVSVSLRVQRTENLEFRCLREGESSPRSSKESQFSLPRPFCSVQALKGLDLNDAYPSEGRSSLFSLLTEMVISSGNTLKDTPRNNHLPAIWESLCPVRSTQN